MSLPPKPLKPSQPSDGKINVLGKRVTPEAGLELLNNAKRQGRLACWTHLQPQLKAVDASDSSKGQKLVLSCDQCQRDLAPSNVSNLSSSHFDQEGNCKAANGSKQAASSSGSSRGSGCGSSSTAPAPKGLPGFTVAKVQQEQALSSLTKYLVTRACPSHIEDPYLKEAFKTLGCPLISRKELCSKRIPVLYNEILAQKMALIKGFSSDDKDPIIGGLATDGWKKKACSQGTPLISANVLLPDGGSYFHKAFKLPHRQAVPCMFSSSTCIFGLEV